MHLPNISIATFLIALIVASPVCGQHFVDRQVIQQIVIVVPQPKSLALSPSLMGSIIADLPLQAIASRSLGEKERVSGLAATIAAIPGDESGVSPLGDALYLTVNFEGDLLSNDEKHELLAAVTNDFSEGLSKAVTRIEGHRLEARQKQIERLKEMVSREKDKFKLYIRLIHDLEGNQSPLSQDQLRGQIQQLSEQLRQADLKHIACMARQDVTESQIAEARVKAGKKSNEDPVLHELELLVDLKEQFLAAKKKADESGLESTDIVAKAKSEVVEARIRLLEQRQMQVDPTLASQISMLNVRLGDGMIDMIESHNVKAELEKQLALAKQQLDKKLYGSAGAEIAQIRRDLAKQRLAHTLRELEELESQSPDRAMVKVIPWVEYSR